MENTEAVRLLGEILDELRRIRAILDKDRSAPPDPETMRVLMTP